MLLRVPQAVPLAARFGTGPSIDWYTNLRHAPVVAVQVRNARWVPAQRFSSTARAAEPFRRYELVHPRAARRLLASMGNSTAAMRIACG
jgi:hypothetical protein